MLSAEKGSFLNPVQKISPDWVSGGQILPWLPDNMDRRTRQINHGSTSRNKSTGDFPQVPDQRIRPHQVHWGKNPCTIEFYNENLHHFKLLPKYC